MGTGQCARGQSPQPSQCLRRRWLGQKSMANLCINQTDFVTSMAPTALGHRPIPISAPKLRQLTGQKPRPPTPSPLQGLGDCAPPNSHRVLPLKSPCLRILPPHPSAVHLYVHSSCYRQQSDQRQHRNTAATSPVLSSLHSPGEHTSCLMYLDEVWRPGMRLQKQWASAGHQSLLPASTLPPPVTRKRKGSAKMP